MAHIVAVANQKGGVGKTTTTVNLAACLADAPAKRRVLLVDMDPQGNATMGCGIDKYADKPSSYDVLLLEVTLRDALQFSESANIQVLAANGDLIGAEVVLLEAERGPLRLRELLMPIQAEFDHILIDCPPSLSLLTVNALSAANSVLIPIQCEYYALEGLAALVATIEKIKRSTNPLLRIEGLLRTMFDARNRLANEVSEQLLASFGDVVYNTMIPRNVRIAEAPSHGQPVTKYDKSSRGAESYRELAKEFLARLRKPVGTKAGSKTDSQVAV